MLSARVHMRSLALNNADSCGAFVFRRLPGIRVYSRPSAIAAAARTGRRHARQRARWKGVLGCPGDSPGLEHGELHDICTPRP